MFEGHAANEHERLLTMFRLAPAAIAVLRGPTHVYVLANDLYLKINGNRAIIGKPGREALPELTAQGIWDMLDGVYASGEAYAGREFLVTSGSPG